jgi:hypothetical protein
MKQQLTISFPIKQINKPKLTHYSDLAIDQKINVKANSAGFEEIFITASLTCWKNHRGFIDKHVHHPDELTEKWFWHHKTNKNRPWDSLKHGQLFREIKKHNS